MPEPVTLGAFIATLPEITSHALITIACEKAIDRGLEEIGSRLSLGRLDPNHDIARAARMAELNASIYLLQQARRGPNFGSYDRAIKVLRQRAIAIHEAKFLPGGYLAVEESVKNLLAAERHHPTLASHRTAEALTEATRAGEWGAPPAALRTRFEDPEDGFSAAYDASMAALFKDPKWDHFFRIWLVLRQQATNDSLARIEAELRISGADQAGRDAAAVAIAGSAERLAAMEACLADVLAGITAVRKTTERTLVVVEDTSGDVKAIRAILESREAQVPAMPTPAQLAETRIELAPALTSGSGMIVGRDNEEKLLLDAWHSGDPGAPAGKKTHIVVLHAIGGAGKTILLRRLVDLLAATDFAGADRVLGWSAYSQGSGENRGADTDTFIADALKFMGHTGDLPASPSDRGKLLARYMKTARTLLLLDGIEPVQNPVNIDGGRLRDPALVSLLKTLLTMGHPGLVIITSRQPLPELEDHLPPAVINRELDHLPTHAGAELLVHLKCDGTLEDLEAAVTEVKNHALSVALLGTYIHSMEGGHIARRDHLGLKGIIDEAEDIGAPDKTVRYARRAAAIIKGFIAAFEAQTIANPKAGALERMLLNIVGLFDRPADTGAIRALLETPLIPGLTDAWHTPDTHPQQRLNGAKTRLRDLRLLSAEDPTEPEALDAHPIIRAHFAAALKEAQPEVHRVAHERLMRHYEDEAKELPDTLDEMRPLFYAVGHGCAAGLYEETLMKIYFRRIRRGDESFINKILGAYAANLVVLAHFFDRPWDQPQADLPPQVRNWLLNCAASALRGLNRHIEAERAEMAGFEMDMASEDWINAAISSSNVSQMRLTLGRIADAIAIGKRSVDLADRAGDAFQMVGRRAALAHTLTQSGDISSAADLFVAAEALQTEARPEVPFLYSVPGYQYCNLLFELGRAAEAQARAAYALELSTYHHQLLSIGLDALSLARAARLEPHDEAAGLELFDRAVAALLESGANDHIPSGYLARAAYLRRAGRLEDAADDLAQVSDLARRGSMKLYLTDYHLESARLALAHIPDAPAEALIPLDPPPETQPPPDPKPRTAPLTQAERPRLEQAIDHTHKAGVLIAEAGYHIRNRELTDLRDRIDRVRKLK